MKHKYKVINIRSDTNRRQININTGKARRVRRIDTTRRPPSDVSESGGTDDYYPKDTAEIDSDDEPVDYGCDKWWTTWYSHEYH